MSRPLGCRREQTGLSEWAVNFRRNSDAFNRNSGALNPSFRRKPESILRGATAHQPNHLRRVDILPAIPTPSTPSFRRKPESILRGATAHRPNHLRRADILSVIPASSTRHSGASRNLSCGERRLTGQTTYYGVRTFYPSFRRPQPRHSGASRNLSCGERRPTGQTTYGVRTFYPSFQHPQPVIPAQAGIYPAESDG